MSEARQGVLAGAMRLLAAREHSQHELRRKLMQKGHAPMLVDEVLTQLHAQGLQSDARFVENFINSRRERGQGPARIQLELQQHQIAPEIIQAQLDSRDAIWRDCAEQVRRKKFGAALPDDYATRMRQAKFLEYRGFTHQQIFALLDAETDLTA